MTARLLRLVPIIIAWLTLSVGNISAAEFASHWPEQAVRPWAGADYWTNPLPDWRVQNGRLECWRGGNDRNVYLITRRLGENPGELDMEITLGRIDPDGGTVDQGWVGFRIGVQGEFNDYRDDVLYGVGMPVGIATPGRLFIGDPQSTGTDISASLEGVTLRLTAKPAGNGYALELEALDPAGKRLARTVRNGVHASWLTGSVALVCSRGAMNQADWSRKRPAAGGAMDAYPLARGAGGNVLFWFRDWKISGDKLVDTEDNAFGPILFTYYTLSRNVLKLTAQFAPVGNNSRTALMEISSTNRGPFRPVAEETIDPLACTATFRVSGWQDDSDIYYRVSYVDKFTGKVQSYDGMVPADPVDTDELVVAAFTGNNDFGFPHADVVRHVSAHKPHLLVYTGDQIYERTGGYYTLRGDDVVLATLDYLRRWYEWGWEYESLIRNLPSVCLPDDHDVFQGNLWGAGGRDALQNGMSYAEGQDAGGYCMPPVWVNMIQHTQTAHMPDPWDPTPADQGISVYYCELLYGGVSFAIVEDRKWKSSPMTAVPAGEIVNGWARNKNYNADADGDVPGAVLLGQRQLNFLESWAADWSGGAWFKSVISQTIFSNVATLPHPGTRGDDIVPELSLMAPGVYAEGDAIVQDHDSNGWPQTGRNEALRRMRKAFAVHIAGDQHLGSTVQYGIDEWGDASYAICVPSVANVWPRRWFPPEPGLHRKADAPRYTGDFRDGFGNLVTVFAISNPEAVEIEPKWINQRAPGYGIIRFNRIKRTVSMANWPRWVDPSAPGAKPYPGWPVSAGQLENYGGTPAGWLPQLRVSGMKNPVVQVVAEQSGKKVYTLRLADAQFRPMVFAPGRYTVKVGEPDTGIWREYSGLEQSKTAAESGILEVSF